MIRKAVLTVFFPLFLSQGLYWHKPLKASGDYHGVVAKFIINIMLFVEWPDSAFTGNGMPYKIAVMGDRQLAVKLSELSENKLVKGRSLEVASVYSHNAVSNYHVLFLGREVAANEEKTQKIINRFLKSPVLLIGDTSNLGRQGVMINFVTRNKQVRFEINSDSVKASKVKMSSELMKLGIIVNNKE